MGLLVLHDLRHRQEIEKRPYGSSLRRRLGELRAYEAPAEAHGSTVIGGMPRSLRALQRVWVSQGARGIRMRDVSRLSKSSFQRCSSAEVKERPPESKLATTLSSLSNSSASSTDSNGIAHLGCLAFQRRWSERQE
jgi:hypothetical protein